jgi:hypothetical protein
MQRIRRIWQAIIDEALFRGYSVDFRYSRRDTYDRGQLVVGSTGTSSRSALR